jgi:phenylacetate-CoA ligase
MSLYTKLCASALFPLHETMKRHDTLRVRRALESSQWLDSDRLMLLQSEGLRQLLARAAVQVPYYRTLFKAIGFDAGAVRGTEDLARLPLLTKQVIRENLDALRAADAVGLHRFNTGGSTGEPLVFLLGRERVAHDVAAKWRATRWWNVDIGDPEVVVWGSPIELSAQDRMRALRDKLLRTRLLPAFKMSQQRLVEYCRELRRVRPRMVFGYPSAIALLAEHANKSGVRLDDLGVRVVFCTAEMLYPDQRELIHKTFAAPVANGYGSRDAGFIAHECPAGGMHITAEDIIVEILSPEGHPLPIGEVGEITVTHLATGDFPFVRYRTGDLASVTQERCICGRGLPLLKNIQGRVTDLIRTADGNTLHGLALVYVLRERQEVRAFRIIQEALDHITVQLVPAAGFDATVTAEIRRGLKARMGAQTKVDIDIVEEIEPDRSGKFRYVVSKLAQRPAH